jgi:DNA mismatch repair protein MutL
MSDIIHLLPDSVANQIAAGEVIQRPASVVKELIENSLDAGATEITVVVKDAGKMLIQVIDNGSGMSETDARMAFERHATSKISKAEDLFAIRSMGFRGEALASIAAVANVELRSKETGSELGISIVINGSEVLKQEAVNCAEGSNFSVRNLFFNIPARRKFLKKNSTELGHILNEFRKTALTRPDVAFSLIEDESTVYKLLPGTHLQRIAGLFGKTIQQNLVPVNTKSSIISISGFIGKPETARGKQTENFFFVNNRFMKHAYFNKAVLSAYDQIIPKDTVPAYFLYFEISPDAIDINIHPQKVEINFENSQMIFQIIRSSVKEALGKYNVVPSIDFDQEGAFEIPFLSKDTIIKQPEIKYNPDYNPFETSSGERTQLNSGNYVSQREKDNLGNWEDLLSSFENTHEKQDIQLKTENIENEFSNKYIQLKNKYIVTPVKSGLMLIDQKRAHERILYEHFRNEMKSETSYSQQTLYPVTIELQPNDFSLIFEMLNQIRAAGFDISVMGKSSVIISGIPSYLSDTDPEELFRNLLENIKSEEPDISNNMQDFIARVLSKSSSIQYGQKLSNTEINHIIESLFACSSPNFSPSGKTIITILNIEELEKKFK